MTRLLKKYQSMRDFEATPEPSGSKSAKKKKKLIFVVQKHAASHLHYDFRLEMEGVLKSWAVPKGPSYDPTIKRLAMMTEDHPYAYADFEGVIPEGNYGAGNVIIWDSGHWEFVEPGDDPVAALKSGKLTFRLHGKKLFGEWALIKTHGRSPRGNEWLLIKHRDSFAKEGFDITTFAPRSIVSDRDVDELDGGRTWQSNRAAASRRAPTLADALKKKAKTKPRSVKRKSAPKKSTAAKKKAPAKRR